MALKLSVLRREFEIRKWSKVIQTNPYLAVLQITGGRAWGRTNLKSRILGDQRNSEHVNTRFAVPKLAREGALRTRFVGLSELFRSAPSAVVYGDEVEDVVTVVKRARGVIDGAVLVGGRFGENLVTARIWEEVLKSEGELAEWKSLLGVLGRKPALINIFDRHSQGTLDVLSKSGGSHRLVRVLDNMHQEVPP